LMRVELPEVESRMPVCSPVKISKLAGARLNAAVINSVQPRGDMVDSGSIGDILYSRFGTDISTVTYIELAERRGGATYGCIWTREIDLIEGVKIRLGHRTERLCVKLAITFKLLSAQGHCHVIYWFG
jgi:hypothetical protein